MSLSIITLLLDTLVPVLFCILLGFFCAKYKIISKDTIPGINKYIFFVSLPSLLLGSLWGIDVLELDWRFFAATLIGVTIVYSLVLVATYRTSATKQEFFTYGPFAGMCSTFSSAIFLGIPVISSLYGQNYIPYCVISFILYNLTVVLVSIAMIETNRYFMPLPQSLTQSSIINKVEDDEDDNEFDEEDDVRTEQQSLIQRNYMNTKPLVWKGHVLLGPKGVTVLNIIKGSLVNPIVLPTCFAILMAPLGIPKPAFLDYFFSLIGSATSGTALFNLGLTMQGKPLVDTSYRGFLVILTKQIVLPMVISSFMALFGVPYDLVKVGYVLNILPPAQMLYVLSARFDNMALPLVSSSLFTGTLTSFPITFMSASLIDAGPKAVFTPQPFTETSLNLLNTIILVFGTLSILGAVWLLLSFVLVPKQRKFPRRLTIYLSIAQLTASFGFIIFAIFDVQSHIKLSSFSLCKFQGFVIQYGATASYCWFFLISLDMYLRIVKEKTNLDRMEKYYHLFGFGFPFLMTISPLFIPLFKKGGHSYGPAVQWCWITNSLAQFVLFYIPLMIFCAIAIILVALVARKIKKVREFHGGSLSFIQVPGTELRVNAFVLMFSFLWLWGLTNRFQQLVGEGDPILFLIYMHTAFSAGQGFFSFLLWGLNDEILNGFYSIFGCLRKRSNSRMERRSRLDFVAKSNEQPISASMKYDTQTPVGSVAASRNATEMLPK